ncbi:MAG: hypothetical protein R3E87_00635 [Burkholderiaceae bacterium]
MDSPIADRVLGGLAIAFSLVTLLAWIPNDIDSGVIEVFRRRITIGDAMLPTALALGIGLCGLGLLVQSLRKPVRRRRDLVDAGHDGVGFTVANLRFIAVFAALMVVSLTVMRWTGPLLVWLFDEAGGSYRALRDTAPWKYAGFLAGGWLMTSFLLVWLAGELRVRWLVIALLCVLALMLAVDLPFDDLLLPPNGDV